MYRAKKEEIWLTLAARFIHDEDFNQCAIIGTEIFLWVKGIYLLAGLQRKPHIVVTFWRIPADAAACWKKKKFQIKFHQNKLNLQLGLNFCYAAFEKKIAFAAQIIFFIEWTLEVVRPQKYLECC